MPTTNHHTTLRRGLLTTLSIIGITVAALAMTAVPVSAQSSEAVQVEGIAVPWPEAPDTCDPAATGPVDYILAMPEGSGSLTGCLYGIRQEARFNEGGQLQVYAAETFVGCDGDRCGSFQIEALITNRWDGPPGVGDQINGRCQHKIVSGTGTGDFAGVEGRLDFKDILVRDADGNLISATFDYKGHLRQGA